jgi:hypothetical protein
MMITDSPSIEPCSIGSRISKNAGLPSGHPHSCECGYCGTAHDV